MFHRMITIADGDRILDVGGYHWFWREMDCENPVTCLNLRIPDTAGEAPSQFTYVRGDARHLPCAEQAYDVVFSNSVIEHLGSYDDQRRFASEIRRVGRSYWVQTPNRSFPIEPHLVAPFIHYLPVRIQRHLIRWLTLWGLVSRPTRKQIDDFLAEVRLPTEREMRDLFPDAHIVAERFLGLKKSLIAVKAVQADVRPVEVGLSIGSNLGDRAGNLDAVRSAIDALAGVRTVAESPVYETEPVDVPAESADMPFLNAVLIVQSDLDPSELAARLRAVEDKLGRTRTPERNMPRTADIDIVYAGRLRMHTPDLTIPHPRWRGRRFVVQPLADVRPDLVLPGETRTVTEILLSLPHTPKVLRYPDI